MNDYEIDEIRHIRHRIFAEHGHDLQKIADHYRKVEKELRNSGHFKFADERIHAAQPTTTEDII